MRISTAKEITNLAHLINRTPQGYRRFIICSPFVSPDVFASHIMPGGKALMSIDVITNEETAERLKAKLGRKDNKVRISACKGLHAKVYIACGINERDSVALIGSFNLTNGALHKNVELGIKLSGIEARDRMLIAALERDLTRLVN